MGVALLVGLVNGSALAHHPCGRPDGLEFAGGRAADHGIAPGVVRGLFVGVGVAVGDELFDVGDGDGVPDGGDGDEDSAGPGPPPWPLDVLLGLVCVVLDGFTDGVLEPVRVAEPSGLPPPPWLLEAGAPEFPLCK